MGVSTSKSSKYTQVHQSIPLEAIETPKKREKREKREKQDKREKRKAQEAQEAQDANIDANGVNYKWWYVNHYINFSQI